ncbi:MAG: cupin domain-containing protein [Clostridiales bacterium]|jgi:transcriptional regulator with XRE-family HTH domain|nr:cupin domain-containing protein [Clostridiales bacterium]
MHKDLMEIPRRMRELREILEISALEMSRRLDVSLEQYEQYENGSADIPISTLYEVAGILHVDFTELITGESPRMDSYSITRSGQGAGVDRYGYSCASLAYNFIDRAMEPLLVTLSLSDSPAPLVTHAGQEFNLVLTGKVKVTINARDHILNAGDSIYFDPSLPHGQSAVDGPATFLTVIKE